MSPLSKTLFIVIWSLLMSINVYASSVTTVRIGGTGSAMSTFKHLAGAFQKTRPDVEIKFIPNLGSRGAVKALQAGKLEVALSASALKIDERLLRAEELGRTPLVLAVAMHHPATNIELESLANALEGKLTSWPDGSPIRLIMRPHGDSDTASLRAISPRIERAVTAAHMRQGLHVAITDHDAADALEKIPGAFGSSTLAIMVSEQRKLKPLALDGKQPSIAALARGEYPHFKSVFAVTETRTSEAVTAFIAFVKSRQGGRVLLTNGYLPRPPASLP